MLLKMTASVNVALNELMSMDVFGNRNSFVSDRGEIVDPVFVFCFLLFFYTARQHKVPWIDVYLCDTTSTRRLMIDSIDVKSHNINNSVSCGTICVHNVTERIKE